MFNTETNAFVIFRFFGNTLDGIAHTTDNFQSALSLTKRISQTQPGTYILAEFTNFEPPMSIDGDNETEFYDFAPLVGCKDGHTVDSFHGLSNIDDDDNGHNPILFISPAFWESALRAFELETH